MTDRRPTSNRASTTPCRSTPTTSSITSRISATRPAAAPDDHHRADAPSLLITARWCSICSVCPGSATRKKPRRNCPGPPEQPLIDLQETFRSLNSRNLLEAYHDAQQALDSALNLFSLGYLPLDQRCIAENLFWAICHKIQKLAGDPDYFPEELEGLDAMLSETYFCNFSMFQTCARSGPSTSCSRSCRSTDWREDRTPCGRPIHPRLRRQNRPLHRPAGREVGAGAARRSTAQELSGSLPDWRVSGDPGDLDISSATPTPCMCGSVSRAK